MNEILMARLIIVELFYQNLRCVESVFRKLRNFYGLHNRLSEITIGWIIEKFDSLKDKKKTENIVVAVTRKYWFCSIKCSSDDVHKYTIVYLIYGFIIMFKKHKNKAITWNEITWIHWKITSRNGDINGHQDNVIWQRWTIFFEVLQKARSLRIIHNRLKDEIINVVSEIELELCKILLKIWTKEWTSIELQ